MKKIPKWIFIKYDRKPNCFYCERCGATRESHLPAPIDDVAKQAEAFSESHKFCKDRND